MVSDLQKDEIIITKKDYTEFLRDKERLDWLADTSNSIGNVQLPTECVLRNAHSLRDAIDDARRGA